MIIIVDRIVQTATIINIQEIEILLPLIMWCYVLGSHAWTEIELRRT